MKSSIILIALAFLVTSCSSVSTDKVETANKDTRNVYLGANSNFRR